MTESIHRHVGTLVEHELRRRRGVLGRLSPDRRAAVEAAVTASVAAAVADVLERARTDERVAAALASVYARPAGAALSGPVSAGAD